MLRRRFAVAVIAAVFLLGAPVAFSASSPWAGLPAVEMLVNGEVLASDPPAVLVGDRVFVPLRFVSEALGAKVQWYDQVPAVEIITEGVFGNTPPTRSTPDKGVFCNITAEQADEAIIRGVGRQNDPFDKVFGEYAQWDETGGAWGLLYTEYSAAGITAYLAARNRDSIPKGEDYAMSGGRMFADIVLSREPHGTSSRCAAYIHQGTTIAKAHILSTTKEGLRATWFTDGMDLALPIEIIVAKPNGESYSLTWNLFGLK